MTDFTITGRLARFGRGGIIEDVSNRLMRDFATCLSTRLGEPAAAARSAVCGRGDPGGVGAASAAAAPPPAAPVKGFSLFVSVVWERVKRLFGGGKG